MNDIINFMFGDRNGEVVALAGDEIDDETAKRFVSLGMTEVYTFSLFGSSLVPPHRSLDVKTVAIFLEPEPPA